MKLIFKSLVLLTFFYGSVQAADIHSESLMEYEKTPPKKEFVSKSACSFRSAMRKLWEDHVTWTRLYIISAINDLPNLDATAKRLLQNQKDLGEALKPFYGDEAGNKLAELLTDHILIAADIIKEAKANDNKAVEMTTKKWGTNADEISIFLYKANPKGMSLAELKSMMQEHLSLTTTEVVAHLENRWEDDVKAYDKVHDQSLKMADMLAFGIIKQFPKKF